MALPRYSANSGNTFSGTAGTSSSTTNTRSSASQNESGLSTYNQDFMSQAGRQAMEQLLAQLSAGGTPAQRAIQEQQMRTMQQLDAQATNYTRETALGDAEGLMQQMLQQTLEQVMPSIMLAQSSAGTSGDAISALLSQDLATRASQGAATAGVGAVADYGQVLASLMGNKSQLAGNQQDDVLASLLQLLQTDVGSASRGTVATKGSARTTNTGTQTTNTQKVDSGVVSSNKADISAYERGAGIQR